MSSTNPQVCFSRLDGLLWIILPWGHFFFAVIEAALLDACESRRVLLAWFPISLVSLGLVGRVVVVVVPARPVLLVFTALALLISRTVFPGPILKSAPTFVVPILAVAVTALAITSWVALALRAAL